MNEIINLFGSYTKPDTSVHQQLIDPGDELLANLMINSPHLIHKHLKHESLLTNKIDKKLTEPEKRDAWADFKLTSRALGPLQSGAASTSKQCLQQHSTTQEINFVDCLKIGTKNQEAIKNAPSRPGLSTLERKNKW